MSDKLTSEIQELIKKRLPMQVAETLQERLRQAEIAESALSLTNERLENARGQVSALLEERDTLKVTVKELQSYKTQAESVAKREKKLEVDLLNVRLEESEKSKKDIFELVKLAFRNPVMKMTENSSVPMGLDNYGGMQYGLTGKTLEKTIE